MEDPQMKKKCNKEYLERAFGEPLESDDEPGFYRPLRKKVIDDEG